MPQPKAKAADKCKLICCTTPPEAVARIREDLARWEPGLWAEEVNYGPAQSPKGRVPERGTDN